MEFDSLTTEDYKVLALTKGLKFAIETLERTIISGLGTDSITEIAFELNMHPATVHSRMRKLGLKIKDNSTEHFRSKAYT